MWNDPAYVKSISSAVRESNKRRRGKPGYPTSGETKDKLRRSTLTRDRSRFYRCQPGCLCHRHGGSQTEEAKIKRSRSLHAFYLEQQQKRDDELSETFKSLIDSDYTVKDIANICKVSTHLARRSLQRLEARGVLINKPIGIGSASRLRGWRKT